MIGKCGICNNNLEQIDHTNRDIFDIYACIGCQKPNYDTIYRQVFFKGGINALATTIRVDEFYVIFNYSYAVGNRRTNYTQIYNYKSVLGIINTDPNPRPLSWSCPVLELDGILDLPVNDLAKLKEKLKIYTLFS